VALESEMGLIEEEIERGNVEYREIKETFART
jgi:hypothetical protein